MLRIIGTQLQRLKVICCFLFLPVMVFAACGSKKDTAYTSLNVAYGADPLQKMDVSLVTDRTPHTPLVIVVHGGGWMAGDKTDANFMKVFLNKAGMNVININYRLANSTTIHYREIMQDIDSALIYITRHAAEWNIRDRGYVFWGGSAGAHLTLLYAYAFDNHDLINAVITLGAPTKLNDVASLSLAKKQDVEGLLPLITGEPYDRDTANAAYIAASPYYGSHLKPALLVHGTNDDIVPVAQSRLLSDLLESKGIEHVFFPLPGGAHGGEGTPAEVSRKLQTVMLQWIKQHS